MNTALITHEDFLKHETPPGHPERIARMEALMELFESSKFDGLERVEATPCETRHLLLCHPQPYIDKIRNSLPSRGYNSLDSDTHMSPGSWDAALRAVGANIQAVDLAMSGETKNVFCAVRPPGHHAETARAMGFCLFGSVAIAARHALEAHGLDRVAIVDFDVHHGNGTSDLMWNEERVLFASTHEMPLYPGTGYPSEQGTFGQIVNKPLRSGSGSADFKNAINEILDRLDEHEPQLVFVSAGFDAHRKDPLATLRLEAEDFAWATEMICDIARSHSQGRVVSSLEGGYDLRGLSESVSAHVEVLMNRGLKNE